MSLLEHNRNRTQETRTNDNEKKKKELLITNKFYSPKSTS